MKKVFQRTANRTTKKGAPGDLGHLLGRRLRTWRLAAGYPLKRLAMELGISISVLSQWENGLRFPSQRHLAALGVYTRIPPRCFLCAVPWPCPRAPAWPAERQRN